MHRQVSQQQGAPTHPTPPTHRQSSRCIPGRPCGAPRPAGARGEVRERASARQLAHLPTHPSPCHLPPHATHPHAVLPPHPLAVVLERHHPHPLGGQRPQRAQQRERVIALCAGGPGWVWERCEGSKQADAGRVQQLRCASAAGGLTSVSIFSTSTYCRPYCSIRSSTDSRGT